MKPGKEDVNRGFKFHWGLSTT